MKTDQTTDLLQCTTDNGHRQITMKIR